jgi:hypothetical protein
MPRHAGLLVASFAIACASLGSAQQAPRQLTARELFYTAPQAAPAAAVKAEPAKAPAQKAAPSRRASVAKAPEPAAPAKPPAPAKTPSARPEPASLPGGGRIVEAAARSSAPAPSNGTALGLKYTILKRTGNDMVEVAPDTVFHAGDRIQFSVQVNGPGYLYIINQGSSGTWRPMFPSPEVDNGDNRVDGWRSYTFPPQSRLVFDEQTGIEKVFIILSREPESDLEKMIYSLQGGAQPAAAPARRAAPKTLVASLNIDDATVGRLRTAYARDLVIEKVDPNTAGEKKEYAVYVVNPSGSPDSRVVADLRLVHQ